jgi:GDP-4-dehydro-6-deoxy-D-mannose reductase
MSAVTGVVVVTGASGFAGSHLVEHLSSSHEVEGWSRSDPPPEVERRARWRRVDLLDRESVRGALREVRPAAIFHCAGLPHVAESWADTAQPLASNVLATHHLLDAMRRAGIACRVLVPGSATVYAASDHPIREQDPIAPRSPYALSKLAQEQLAMRAGVEDGIDVIVTRSFNHTGPRQSPAFVAPALARQIASIERGDVEPVIRVGNLDAQRDITDVRDVVRAYAALMAVATPRTIYNVASGVGHTIRSVLDALVARARVAVRVEVDPARLRPNDLPAVIGDASRLRQETGWSPDISFDRMLDDLLAYWRARLAS